MKLNKERLKEIKEFLEYLKLNTTLKEKKSLLTLGSVDFLLIICTLYSIFEETSDIDLIVQGFASIGITTGILGTLLNIYKKEKEKSKYKVLKR